MESSIRNSEKEVWAKLWNSKVTPRQQILMWRILNDCLPSKDNLNLRGINCDPLYPRCNDRFETTKHCLKNFNWENHIWYGSQLHLNFSYNHIEGIKDWIKNNINQMNLNNILYINQHHRWNLDG